MYNNIPPAEKLRNNSYDLEDVSFEIDMSNVTVSSFNFSYGDIQDVEFDDEPFVTAIDGMPVDNYVLINKDIFEEIIQDLELTTDISSSLYQVRAIVDRMIKETTND